MELTPDEKKHLRAQLHDAIGAGLASNTPPESPPLPPTRQSINQAAYWAMGEVEKALTRKRWAAHQERDALYEENARLRAVIEAVASAGTLDEVFAALAQDGTR